MTAPSRSPLSILGESLFGEASSKQWRPLPLRTFFSEGWDEPFVYPVNGSGGAPRQGWINSLDGVFYRLWFFNFSYANDVNDNGNQYVGSYTIFTPVNRRFQLRFDVPFIVSNKGGASNTYHGNFGDLVVAPRFLLSESRDFTQVTSLNIRTPTGETSNGQGVASLTPQYEFWANISGGWVARGGVGSTIPTNDVGARTTVDAHLGLGQYLTPHDATPFGDLVYYVSAVMRTTVDGRSPDRTFFSLTPGFRTHLGDEWYILGGLEVPVTGPQAFDYQTIFWFMKVY